MDPRRRESTSIFEGFSDRARLNLLTSTNLAVALSDPFDDGKTTFRLPRHPRLPLLPRTKPLPDPRERTERLSSSPRRDRRFPSSRSRGRSVLVVLGRRIR